VFGLLYPLDIFIFQNKHLVWLFFWWCIDQLDPKLITKLKHSIAAATSNIANPTYTTNFWKTLKQHTVILSQILLCLPA
jgi:hypothetical protein